MRNLIIFGDTPFAERLFKYISIEAKDKVIAFTQEKSFVSRKEIQGVPVVPFEELDEHFNEEFEIIIGIGYTQMNQLKKRIYNMCKERKYKIETYISTNAIVYSKGPTIPPVGAYKAPITFSDKLGSSFKTSSLFNIFSPLTPRLTPLS